MVAMMAHTEILHQEGGGESQELQPSPGYLGFRTSLEEILKGPN